MSNEEKATGNERDAMNQQETNRNHRQRRLFKWILYFIASCSLLIAYCSLLIGYCVLCAYFIYWNTVQ